MEELRVRLRILRISKGCTQREISEFLGVAQNTYSGYETGEIVPPLINLIKLAEFYGVSLDYICGLSDS